MTPEKFIGKAWYDQLGQMVWGETKKGDQLIADLRGWGAIQNLFKSEVEAATFQDEVGVFITDAINEKIERISDLSKRYAKKRAQIQKIIESIQVDNSINPFMMASPDPGSAKEAAEKILSKMGINKPKQKS